MKTTYIMWSIAVIVVVLVMVIGAASWTLTHLPRVALAPGGKLRIENQGFALSHGQATAVYADGTMATFPVGRIVRGGVEVPLPPDVKRDRITSVTIDGSVLGLRVVSHSMVEPLDDR